MNTRRRYGSTPRSAALIALAALAVHQLRYLLAYGSDAHTELLRQGHAYLFQSLPVLIGFGLSAIAASLVRAVLRAPVGTAIESHRLRALLYATSSLSYCRYQEYTPMKRILLFLLTNIAVMLVLGSRGAGGFSALILGSADPAL